MRRSLVVGNWKMHGYKAGIASLIEGIKAGLVNVSAPADMAVCPPSIYIDQVARSLSGTAVSWGAQNVSEHAEGAFTGEVSTQMLDDLGCGYVIIGHSERRSLFGEGDQEVAAKMQAALAGKVKPILCVGESLQQRESGETLALIATQLQAVVEVVGIKAMQNSVIAYEPVWAIGTGKTATPGQAQEVHAHIRQVLAEYDAGIASQLQILYGGSVKPSNAAELFAKQDIDGALVGGASLKAEDFLAIVMAAA